MPFDGRGFDIGPPSLRTLADVLRDRSRWPEGFVWNYASGWGCALGMDRALWGRKYHATTGMGAWRLVKLTMFLHWKHWCAMRDVTPEHVADAIDAYLATVPERAVADG